MHVRYPLIMDYVKWETEKKSCVFLFDFFFHFFGINSIKVFSAHLLLKSLPANNFQMLIYDKMLEIFKVFPGLCCCLLTCLLNKLISIKQMCTAVFCFSQLRTGNFCKRMLENENNRTEGIDLLN